MGEAHVTVDGTGDNTVVGVLENTSALYYEKRDIPHDEMTKIFLQWLRDVPVETRMLAIAGIVMEYQVSAHINTTSEIDRLQRLNLQDENAIAYIILAAMGAAGIEPKSKKRYVHVKDIASRLEAISQNVPHESIYTVLKTIEYGTVLAIETAPDTFLLRDGFDALYRGMIEDEKDEFTEIDGRPESPE